MSVLNTVRLRTVRPELVEACPEPGERPFEKLRANANSKTLSLVQQGRGWEEKGET
jgi:hypothetical protein